MVSNTISNWREALLPEQACIEDAIRSLNEAAVQIAIVVNAAGELIGTITDGDIRRGLLRGLHVGSPIESIIFRAPLVVPPEMRGEITLAECAGHRRRKPTSDSFYASMYKACKHCEKNQFEVQGSRFKVFNHEPKATNVEPN